MIRSSRLLASSWLVVGLSLLGLAAMVVYVATGPASWLSLAGILMAIGAVAVSIGRVCLVPAPPAGPPRSRTRWASLIAVLPAAGLAAWVADSHIDRGAGTRALLGAWLGAIALTLLAAWWTELVTLVRRVASGTTRPPQPAGATVAICIAMLAVAFLPRIVRLDRFTTVPDGDEGTFMVAARAAQHGAMPDIFGPGFLGNPNLYPAMTGWLASLAGSPPADYRILSGTVGALGVIATWRLGRHLLDERVAIAGAAILATMPLNMQFSRSALNNITDASVLAGALLFLVRAVRSGRRGDAALTGVVLGLGYYGYFGARAFPGIVVVAMVILVLGRRIDPRAALHLGAWMVAGFVVTALPLLMAFWTGPAEFGQRFDDVSPLSAAALRADPAGSTRLFLENLRVAALYPWVSNLTGFYRHADPFLGWPAALLLPLGLAAWVVRVTRDRDVTLLACLSAPWALLLGGVALTVPVASQRLLALTPLFALAAGTGLVVVVRWLAASPRGGSAVATVLLAAALVTIGIGELRWYASEDRQIESYADYRTIMMWDIGWRASHAGPATGDAPAVLFAGPPFVFTGGFNNLVIQAPDLKMTDLPAPLAEGAAPALPDGAMIVIVGERRAERCVAERLYPDATVAEARTRDGMVLYIALYRAPLAGWSTAETPAGTAFSVATASPCG